MRKPLRIHLKAMIFQYLKGAIKMPGDTGTNP